jgi:hypothetical protein
MSQRLKNISNIPKIFFLPKCQNAGMDFKPKFFEMYLAEASRSLYSKPFLTAMLNYIT